MRNFSVFVGLVSAILVLLVDRSSAIMVYITSDKRALLFHDQGFHLILKSWCRQNDIKYK